ncbi:MULTISPECIES: hypothetical protein, partial [Streptomyces]|uniref:Uncharacterized protein n=1 Tax=Streptomyces dengpaensis TaxID=2049881 RepID=A0ABM6STB5_9ACTN
MLGLGAGGWGLWLETEEHLDRAASRERITRACDGLVDPDKVLGLNGGAVRARPGSGDEDGMSDLDAPEALATLPTECEIYRVGDPGTSYNHFLLSVWQNPSDDLANLVSGWDDPFWTRMYERADDLTLVADDAAPHPLGDGRLGSYYDHSVIVKAVCTDAEGDTTSVNAQTVAKYFEDTEVTDADRRTLAELARTAAERAAAKLGCTTTLPVPQEELPTPRKRVADAESAGGSCGWYAELIKADGRGRLPDRALAAPVGAHSHEESCLLAMSEKGVRALWPDLTEDEVHSAELRDVLHVAPWWLRTTSYFGDEAAEVKAESHGTGQTALTPGTAGRSRDANVWWASSTCAGQPALHTLSIDYPYDDIVKERLQSLFKAYVADVAARRDCTDVKFPATSTFRAD